MLNTTYYDIRLTYYIYMPGIWRVGVKQGGGASDFDTPYTLTPTGVLAVCAEQVDSLWSVQLAQKVRKRTACSASEFFG